MMADEGREDDNLSGRIVHAREGFVARIVERLAAVDSADELVVQAQTILSAIESAGSAASPAGPVLNVNDAAVRLPASKRAARDIVGVKARNAMWKTGVKDVLSKGSSEANLSKDARTTQDGRTAASGGDLATDLKRAVLDALGQSQD